MPVVKSLNTIHVINLGRLSYNVSSQVQKWFQSQHLINGAQSAQHMLLIVEHDPVYTLGYTQSLSSKESTRLSSLGAEVIKSNRGGLTTFHGPGQLVAYPIIHLTNWHRNLTLRKYVAMLEHVAIHTCRMLGIPANSSLLSVSHTGAWVNDKKICAIGVHCKRHVTTHGLAMNCNVDLKWFQHIVPCGIEDKGVTSISDELNRNVSIKTVLPQFLSSFEAIFRCNVKHYSSMKLENLLFLSNQGTSKTSNSNTI